MWDKIIVEQYQQITAINKQEMAEDEKIVQVIQILFNLTEAQVNDLPLSTFQQYATQAGIAFQTLRPGQWKKTIKANGKRYRLQYDPATLRFGQYIELQHFLKGGLVENLHLLAASIARPVQFRFFTMPNRSEQHAQVADDFLTANFLDLFSCLVFFSRRMTASQSSGSRLSEPKTPLTVRMKNLINRLEAKKTALKKRGAGSILPPKSPSMSASL